MCGAAGAWLPWAETRDSVGVGVGVGFGGSLGLMGFGGAGATGGCGLATATAAGSAGVGTVPAAEWDLLLALLLEPAEVRRLVLLLLRGLGAEGGIEVARDFCSGAKEGGAVEDDCCCDCWCCCCCGCCCGW
jgi:hypothetical protein